MSSSQICYGCQDVKLHGTEKEGGLCPSCMRKRIVELKNQNELLLNTLKGVLLTFEDHVDNMLEHKNFLDVSIRGFREEMG